MTPKIKAKKFDCLAWKESAQKEIYDEIKGLSPAEEIEYFQRKAARGFFGRQWKNLLQR